MAGVVERRLLINYGVDPELAATMIPAPFKPQLVNGWAVAGICLIGLGQLRPRGLPARLGLTSENAAHRFAVQWQDQMTHYWSVTNNGASRNRTGHQ